MAGELTAIREDLADHLSAELAGLEVRVAAWPPDGVGEPSVWIERDAENQPSARRTVRWSVVSVVPAGRHPLLDELDDALWYALDSWHPAVPGVAVNANEIDGASGPELVAGDALPGHRWTVPTVYRPC